MQLPLWHQLSPGAAPDMMLDPLRIACAQQPCPTDSRGGCNTFTTWKPPPFRLLQVCLAAEKCGHLDFDSRQEMWYRAEGFHCRDAPASSYVSFLDIYKKVTAARAAGCLMALGACCIVHVASVTGCIANSWVVLNTRIVNHLLHHEILETQGLRSQAGDHALWRHRRAVP